MASPSPKHSNIDLDAGDEIDLDLDTTSALGTATSPTSTGLNGLGLKITPKPRTGSVTLSTSPSASSSVNKVRAAAAMWEHKDPKPTSKPNTTTPAWSSAARKTSRSGSTSTSSPRSTASSRVPVPGSSSTASAAAAAASGSPHAVSPRLPLTPKLTSPTLSSPRTPPSAYKTLENKRNTGGGSSGGIKPLKLTGRSASTNSISSITSSRSATSPRPPAADEIPSVAEEETMTEDVPLDDEVPTAVTDEVPLVEPTPAPVEVSPKASIKSFMSSPKVATSIRDSPKFSSPTIPSPEIAHSHVLDESPKFQSLTLEESPKESPKHDDVNLASPEQNDMKLASPEYQDVKLASPEQNDIKLVVSPEQNDIKLPSPEHQDVKLASPEHQDAELASPEHHDVKLASPELPSLPALAVSPKLAPLSPESNFEPTPLPSAQPTPEVHNVNLSPEVQRLGLASPDAQRGGLTPDFGRSGNMSDLSPASVYEDFSPSSGKVDLLPAAETIAVSPVFTSGGGGLELETHPDPENDDDGSHYEQEEEEDQVLSDVELSPPPKTPSKLSFNQSTPDTPERVIVSPAAETPRAFDPATTITPASPMNPEDLRDANNGHDLPLLPATPVGQTLTINEFEEVKLSPAKHEEPTPSSTPQRSLPSIFSRVLDYNSTPPPAPPKDKEVAADKDASPTLAKEDKQARTASTASKDSKESLSTSRSRFFTSATSAFGGFNLPSVSLPSMPAMPSVSRGVSVSSNSDITPPSEPVVPSPAALSPAALPSAATSPGGTSNWRTTMSQFLSTRAASMTGPSSAATPPSPLSSAFPPRTSSIKAPTHISTASQTTAANLLLHRLDSPTALRDRRQSREVGGSDMLREGFERVRGEMEGAARDIRRQRARGSEIDNSDIDWVFWGAVVQDYEEVARTQPKELSKAIQQGIPPVIRGPIWQLMSSSKSSNLEETYKALLKLNSPHEKAIHKDITRTFPTHKFFQNTGAGQDGLFMVVKAYSLYDREVGYTQGIAFIVAALLLNMPDEEAFCVLVRLMDSYNLRSHYLADMPGLQLRLYQFDRLLEDVLPLLSNHLVRKGVKSSMFASQWFMTLFSYRFPLSLVYRVLDIVLAEGIEAIFRFSLALLRKSEDEFLKLEFEDIIAYLQGDMFEVYRADPGEGDAQEGSREGEEEWRTNDFVRDAYEVHITPLMLDQYESEWEEKCRAEMAHAREIDQLRTANRHLSAQIKTLESSLATMNTEHVELVRQLVMAKIAKEDMETELVKYKSLCASLSQAVPNDVDGALASNPSGLSLASVRSAAASMASSSPSLSNGDHLGDHFTSPPPARNSATSSRSISPGAGQ